MATSPFTGGPVALTLPTPMDPATLDVWAQQLNAQALQPLADKLNEVIGNLNGGGVVS